MSARSTRPPGNTSRLGMKRCLAPRMPISMCGSLFSIRKTIRLAACLARTVLERTTSAESSGKVKSLCLQVGSKAETLWHRKLARNVLAPADAVPRWMDVVVLLAAGRDRIAGVAARVVLGDVVGQCTVIVTFLVYNNRWRQAHRDRAAEHRPSHRQAGDGIDAVGQAEQWRDALDMAADIADRAGAQADCIRRGHELAHRQGAI